MDVLCRHACGGSECECGAFTNGGSERVDGEEERSSGVNCADDTPMTRLELVSSRIQVRAVGLEEPSTVRPLSLAKKHPR